MTRIAVSENALVDYSHDRWRLIQLDEASKPRLLLEAKAGAPLRFSGYFAVSRDLPEAGQILKADLGQVLLGWSSESGSWQLGITLSPEVSLARASRWFEVLRLAHPDASVHEATASELGKALARTLDIPFVSSQQDLEATPVPEPAPLVALPLELSMWRLQPAKSQGADESELELRRDQGWLRGRLRQIAWYGLMTAVYLWVSIATLTSELGLPIAGTLIPNPAWLPYLGIVVAAMLLLAIMRQAWIILREPDAIMVKPREQAIIAWRGGQLLWKVKAGNVQSIYASEVVKKRGRRHTVLHGEINLHLLDGSFKPLLIDPDKLSDGLLPGVDPQSEQLREEGLRALEPAEAATALQGVAGHIALALGDLPLWHDRLLR